jgi:multidrug efflux pump subunit AcrB
MIRFQIAVMVFLMTNAIAFCVGLVPVLMIPSLANNAFETIPAVVVASVIVSAPLAWFIAPRLRARYWRARSQQ